jgi:hypothetical protein
MEAASGGHVEVARALLDHGAGVNTHSNDSKDSMKFLLNKIKIAFFCFFFLL